MRHTLEVGKSAVIGLDPRFEVLRKTGFCKGIIGSAPNRGKQVGGNGSPPVLGSTREGPSQ